MVETWRAQERESAALSIAQDYVDQIKWRVDFEWPQDPPALIDELIDYVYVEPLR